MNPLKIEFCGEWYDVVHPNDFHIGRESDLVIDDNPYLHRRFLRIYEDFGLLTSDQAVGEETRASDVDLAGVDACDDALSGECLE